MRNSVPLPQFPRRFMHIFAASLLSRSLARSEESARLLGRKNPPATQVNFARKKSKVFWDFWNITLSKFQYFPILAILCWRWGESNSVHTVSLFLLCETCSCKRNLCVGFYFHWFYKAFSPYWSSTEMVWHCFLSSNLHVFAGRFAHGVVLFESSKIVSFSHCDSAFSRKRR